MSASVIFTWDRRPSIRRNTIHRSYRRTGNLWEDRYKAILTQAETYMLTCMRYRYRGSRMPGPSKKLPIDTYSMLSPKVRHPRRD